MRIKIERQREINAKKRRGRDTYRYKQRRITNEWQKIGLDQNSAASKRKLHPLSSDPWSLCKSVYFSTSRSLSPTRHSNSSFSTVKEKKAYLLHSLRPSFAFVYDHGKRLSRRSSVGFKEKEEIKKDRQRTLFSSSLIKFIRIFSSVSLTRRLNENSCNDFLL